MMCVISQPRFFPGLHYLHRMMVADVFVIFDTARFTPRHEENRAKLKSPDGTRWLTVPVRKTNREQLVLDTEIDDSQNWRPKAVRSLGALYGKAPFYESFGPEVVSILEAPHRTLTQIDTASWEPALRLLGIECRFVRASELPPSGGGPRLLLDICKHIGADSYLSGAFGRDYLDAREFAAEGVALKFHEYDYPLYPQRFGDHVPFLSYLDMLFNTGLERDKVLAGGRVVSSD